MQKLQKKAQKSLKKFKYLIGIDEVGRGPVAGPVSVCAALVVFDDIRAGSKKIKDIFKDRKIEDKRIVGREKGASRSLPMLRDSKRLTEAGREMWFSCLSESKIEFALSHASAKKIDEKGIAVCIRLLIHKNIKKLQEKINFDNDEVLIVLDGGLKAPENFINQETIIGGDDKEPIISFASIYAKVSRDRLMKRFSKNMPQYFFSQHKGYGTKQHLEAIRKHGPSNIHRHTFLSSVLAARAKQG